MSHLDFRTEYFAVGFNRQVPGFDFLCVDSLGGGKVDRNTLLAREEGGTRLMATAEVDRFKYRSASSNKLLWEILVFTRKIVIRSFFDPDAPEPFELTFSQKESFATLLGLMAPGEALTQLPAVLHIPNQGSIRVQCNEPGMKLHYDASRDEQPPYVSVRFPAADGSHPMVEYALEVDAIHPDLPGIAANPLYDGFRRNYLSIFQVNPRKQLLANNSASDNCSFTVFEYAAVAKHAPPLCEGLTCNDLIRMTMDRYLSGFPGYGQPEYPANGGPHLHLDVYPSLILAACDYVESSGDLEWATANLAGMDAWGREMLAIDTTGNGLLKHARTGNYGDRPRMGDRPSNWWDTINFGYEDAYANALAYRAIIALADLASRVGMPERAAFYHRHAERLKSAYLPTFLNPDSGILAGWKSKDGKLHDYWFTFVNGMAISFGLVEGDQANRIMDLILAKFADVSYDRFDLGVPGNLVPVHKADYVKHCEAYEQWNHWVGEPNLDDGTDAFQLYENGGATACHAYYLIKALFTLGRSADARRILHPMLETFAKGGFSGFDADGRSYDWMNWNGEANGYEGLLVDSYLTLLAVLDDCQRG